MSDSEHQPRICSSSRLLSSDRIYPNKRWWNIILLGTAFLLCCTAFGLIQHIQIIVGTSDGLRSISVAPYIYGSLMLSCLFAPFVIKKFGTKLTIVFATFFHTFINVFLLISSYFLVNFFPWYAGSIAVLSVALGLSAAMLWVAQGTHLTSSAIKVAEQVGEAQKFVINRFNGVFFFVFQLSQLIGDSLSLIVLHSGMNDEKPINVSSCGVHSCGTVISSGAPTPSAKRVHLLIMAYCIIGFVAFLLSMCLDQQPSAISRIESDTGSVVDTVRLTGNWKLYLLIPVFMYSGMEQAFIMGDFTKAYVTCTLGVSHIFDIMAAFCLTDAAISLLVGWIGKFTGHMFLFCLGTLVQISLMVVMYLWTPIEDIQDSWQLYLMAAGWGAGDAVFQTQCASIVGAIFADRQSPAFSNYRFWQSNGFGIIFALSISGVVCISHKLIGIFSWLLFSLVMYLIWEYKIRREINPYRLDDS